MFVRQCYRRQNGKRHAYWALVESYRTERGPRQRVVAWLGRIDEAGRLGVQEADEGRSGTARQQTLFDEPEPAPRWVEVNASAVRVENCRQFGGPWLALELIRRLGLDAFFEQVMPRGQESVPWSVSALLLIIARLCEPSSELYIAEQWYAKTALPELLGVPVRSVDDNRLYRALDHLLPHKEKLEAFLKSRLGELFALEYDLLLYDITSTYFEGQANFELAQRSVPGILTNSVTILACSVNGEKLPMLQPRIRSLFRFLRCWLMCAIALVAVIGSAHAQRLHVPRKHDRPPGPPLSPEEAVAKMTVPEGFSVEIVAAEPDIVNPVAMFIDEQGRFWITESLEYPRREPGPGRDRVKVLEDTDGDGRVDKVRVFADGLNIPSGIAVGYGGVWVANSPDLLFMQDTDGDLKADKIETVVTGFGRTDTHELPNSLTWGPDGWLYGLNGVFNYSHVKYAEGNPNYNPDHPGWEFTCAMFRIHPRTREFQVFAEGTSNPWGIAINDEGNFFISACVIDHLWHIVETGYYIRQGGPYPPHTWPMGSIVKHKHQKAAYCGITWFDSDAYPEEYRRVLYMGNIHGGCINADIVERHGSTYRAKPHPGFRAKRGAWEDDEYGLIRKTGDPETPKLADFLTANDAWFMPVVQKTGPDGCLYILDWYDRYHCYQDANADPEGIERAKGRLYRVRYKDTPHARPFDLTKKSDDELIALLGDPNVFYRETAQRLLAERSHPATRVQLEMIVFDPSSPRDLRTHALWSRLAMIDLNNVVGHDPFRDSDNPDNAFILRLLEGSEVWQRSWGRRLANHPRFTESQEQLHLLAADESPAVRLQTAIGLRSKSVANLSALRTILENSANDQHLTHIAWSVLRHHLLADPVETVDIVVKWSPAEIPQMERLFPRVVDQVLDTHVPVASRLFRSLSLAGPASQRTAARVLDSVAEHIASGELEGKHRDRLKYDMADHVVGTMEAEERALADSSVLLAAMWHNPEATRRARDMVRDLDRPKELRVRAIEALITAEDAELWPLLEETVFSARAHGTSFQEEAIAALSRSTSGNVPRILLSHLPSLEERIQPKAVEVLTQRTEWSIELLKAIEAKRIASPALNFNQLQRVASTKDGHLQELVARVYGSVRPGERGDRRRVVNDMRNYLSSTPGDPHKGFEVYRKVCGQCHKIYGEGAEVGPDITANGRNDWMQLLYNVFDPSQVIGPGYQARILVTTDGRVLTGLPVEESEQRVVLKTQGGKVETIPREQIDEYQISDTSMMPEQLEKQLEPQELADLFSFLALDKPPSDPSARYLPGAPRHDR